MVVQLVVTHLFGPQTEAAYKRIVKSSGTYDFVTARNNQLLLAKHRANLSINCSQWDSNPDCVISTHLLIDGADLASAGPMEGRLLVEQTACGDVNMSALEFTRSLS